jgi:hypothetical protein
MVLMVSSLSFNVEQLYSEVMLFLKSPPEIDISIFRHESSVLMVSIWHISLSLVIWASSGMGLKRYLMQREPRGSIILGRLGKMGWWRVLGDVVAYKAKSCSFGVIFYNSPQRRLRIHCHRVCLIENNNFIVWAFKFP